MAIQRLDNIGVAVRDVERVARFFADQVGLPTELDLAGEPPSAQVSVGEQYLYLFRTTDTAGPTKRLPDLVGNPQGLDHVSFTVDDVDRTYAELVERGVAFDAEPATEQAWNIRLAGFADPEGNRYYLVQSLSAA
ncbi:VOC family protein [Nocardia brasiliensis]|uniref:VOC family protein n=1 Tax=Nocardia brasiliensis TaxID=37326 RepID=UPI00366CA0B8